MRSHRLDLGSLRRAILLRETEEGAQLSPVCLWVTRWPQITTRGAAHSHAVVYGVKWVKLELLNTELL